LLRAARACAASPTSRRPGREHERADRQHAPSAEQLDVPLRDRNRLLLAAGYAPRYGARSLDDPELAQVRDALGRGTAVDITVAELSIEAFFPADPETAERLAAEFADS
jgi:hypothetical protein